MLLVNKTLNVRLFKSVYLSITCFDKELLIVMPQLSVMHFSIISNLLRNTITGVMVFPKILFCNTNQLCSVRPGTS